MKPLSASTKRLKSLFRAIAVSLFKPRCLASLVEFAGAVAFRTERLVTRNGRYLFVIVPRIAAGRRRLHAIERQIVDHASVLANVCRPAEEIDREFAHLGIDGPGFVGAAGFDRLQI